MLSPEFVTIVELFIVFFIPLLMIYLRIIPFEYQMQVIYALTIGVVFAMIAEGWTAEMMGFTTDNLLLSIVVYGLFTLVGVLILELLAKFTTRPVWYDWRKDKSLLYGFFPISVGQELIFRSYLIPVLFVFFDQVWLVILVNALLFASMHLIFKLPKTVFLTLFAGGAAFAGIYIVLPNIVLISLSHAALNFVIVHFGFLREEHRI
ncbi:MAG: CPBP family intramembrane metalloprotease [Candidatus Woesearchaeota archaeon]|nr:MAG: CPBP family intramembrane metalloprotease [Candidatus Woesearchaeota archaeon]